MDAVAIFSPGPGLERAIDLAWGDLRC